MVVPSGNVNILGATIYFFELTTKKSRQNFFLENLSGKSDIFSAGVENVCDRIHDLPDFEPDSRRCTCTHACIHDCMHTFQLSSNLAVRKYERGHRYRI